MAGAPDVANDFEAWARVAALLRQCTPETTAAALREIGLDTAVWREVNEDWARLLNEDIAAGRMDRPQRYALICREEQTAQREQRSSAADFRDRLTPRKAPMPASKQPDTLPGLKTGRAASRAHTPAKTQDALPTNDFRQELSPVEDPLPRPLGGQLETAAGARGADLVEATRQANEAALWTLQRYAQLMADLSSRPDEADEIWTGAGITNTQARPHVQRHWKRKMDASPTLLERYNALVDELRS